MTIVCVMNATTTIFDDNPILHIQSNIHSNLNTRTLSFVPTQSTVCICTHTAHLSPFCVCTFSLFKYILYIPTMVSQEDGYVAYNLRYHFIVTINSEEIS